LGPLLNGSESRLDRGMRNLQQELI